MVRIPAARFAISAYLPLGAISMYPGVEPTGTVVLTVGWATAFAVGGFASPGVTVRPSNGAAVTPVSAELSGAASRTATIAIAATSATVSSAPIRMARGRRQDRDRPPPAGSTEGGSVL